MTSFQTSSYAPQHRGLLGRIRTTNDLCEGLKAPRLIPASFAVPRYNRLLNKYERSFCGEQWFPYFMKVNWTTLVNLERWF